ncbi:MAG TPA: hypothetical protein VMF09_00880 [Solirubrobacteraceae bacterium]|nr:hypothetical protein [Solirubrobacteraceae bacterium]
MVYIVRTAHGLDAPREFAETMRAHPPGIEHRLILAMKGFRSELDAAPYIAAFGDLDFEVAYFPEPGIDLGLYFEAAARIRGGRYCFLSSHNRPVADGWLAKLNSALDLPDVGIVGPTGSWASFHSWVTYSMGLPSFYRGVLPPVREARKLLREVDFEQLGIDERSKLDSLRTRLKLLSQLPEELFAFPPFPVAHVRTAAFMLSHDVLRAMRLFVVRTKMDTYVLESGSLSLTNQAMRMGLRALVVDSEGAVYEPDEWHRSGTLWQGQQERLVLRDNRTSYYERGDLRRRQVLAGLAWGHYADPSPPRESRQDPHGEPVVGV